MKFLKKISITLFTIWFSVFPFAAEAALCNTNSIQLNGTTNYVTAADSVSTSPTGGITIEANIYFDSSPGDEASVYVKENSAGTGSVINFRPLDLSTLDLTITGSGGNFTGAGTVPTMSTGTWYHVAVTADFGATKIKYYVNGTLQATITPGGADTDITDSTGVTAIGAFPNSPALRYFPGKIDDVRLYNTVRSGAAIASDYQQELVGNETGLQAYWKFDNTLTDTTLNGNTLTNVNSATFSTSVPFVGTCTTESATGDIMRMGFGF